jgi:hypothetical protein
VKVKALLKDFTHLMKDVRGKTRSDLALDLQVRFGVTNVSISKLIGKSEPTVSRYFNKRPIGTVPRYFNRKPIGVDLPWAISTAAGRPRDPVWDAQFAAVSAEEDLCDALSLQADKRNIDADKVCSIALRIGHSSFDMRPHYTLDDVSFHFAEINAAIYRVVVRLLETHKSDDRFFDVETVTQDSAYPTNVITAQAINEFAASGGPLGEIAEVAIDDIRSHAEVDIDRFDVQRSRRQRENAIHLGARLKDRKVMEVAASHSGDNDVYAQRSKHMAALMYGGHKDPEFLPDVMKSALRDHAKLRDAIVDYERLHFGDLRLGADGSIDPNSNAVKSALKLLMTELLNPDITYLHRRDLRKGQVLHMLSNGDREDIAHTGTQFLAGHLGKALQDQTRRSSLDKNLIEMLRKVRALN